MVPPTEQEIIDLRTSLKRCTPQTIEAAVRLRTTGDLSEVPTVVYGIIERHLPAETTRDLSQASDDTRLIEDLGIDSLTLLEIVLSIEETVGISVENDELREIATLGQVKAFIAHKIATAADPKAAKAVKTRRYTQLEVGVRLPQQPPFFFLGDAEIKGNVVRSSYAIRGDEYFLEGHFKDNPVMPASLVFEALGQAACLWVLECAPDQIGTELGTNEVLFASMEEAHFYRRAVPGDTLDFEVEMLRVHAPVAVFKGIATRNGEKVAQIGHLVLAFGSEVVEHLSNRETEAATKAAAAAEAAPAELSAPAEGGASAPAHATERNGSAGLELPVVSSTRMEDAPKGSVTRDDHAQPDPEDPVTKGAGTTNAKPEEDEFDRNFGI